MNKNIIYFIGKLVVSIILIWYLTFKLEIEFSDINIKKFNPIFIVWVIVFFGLLLANNTARWYVVLKTIGADLPAITVAKILYIAEFFNQILLSSIGGDAIRIYITQKSAVGLSRAITSVLLERIVTLTGLVLLVVFMQPILADRIGDNPTIYVFPSLAILITLSIVALLFLDKLPKRIQNIGKFRGLKYLAKDAKSLFLSPKRAAIAISLGMVGNIYIAIMAYMIARTVGINVELLECLVLIPPVILITTLPISIAGWGVREGAMVAAFAFVGVPQEEAFLMSILFGFANAVLALPGGLLWVFGGDRRKDVAK